MSARIFVIIAFSIAALTMTGIPAFAGSNPSAGGQEVAVLNEHLASLVVAAQPQPPLKTWKTAPQRAAGTRFANATASRPVHLAPFLLQLAGRYNRAERLLHFRSHGLDANFWGAVGGGRIKVSYAVKF